MEDFQENIKTLLNNKGEIKKIPGLTDQGIEATTKLLEKILETPDISEQAKEFLWSKESPKELKVFNVVHEKSRKEGLSEGFAKGVAVSAIVLLGIMLFKKES